nr:MAG TPA: hypothetical protein [Bacteriophage sp.]
MSSLALPVSEIERRDIRMNPRRQLAPVMQKRLIFAV